MVRYGLQQLRACLPGTGARVVALLFGPCTEGPGLDLVVIILKEVGLERKKEAFQILKPELEVDPENRSIP
ncbi:hypothetical protein L1987_80723 [Smallanthus sonchifolius]|uniref:Uncharacterized protein n=1 Tax=Smallanthus sonchifolius TaxID=185202 RepID=A0ACB8YPJ2_9ASTR|nr:hypothetical protein L1987_80723 [Smallanthus sonchifolius]